MMKTWNAALLNAALLIFGLLSILPSWSATRPVKQVRLSRFHSLTVDFSEWSAAQTMVLGGPDFLFEHRKFSALRGIGRTEFKGLNKGQSAEDYLRSLCAQRKGSLIRSKPGLHVCAIPSAAPQVTQYLAAAKGVGSLVAIDSLTFTLPTDFTKQSRERAKALVETLETTKEGSPR